MLACLVGGCSGVSSPWPDFGFGWRADQFPTIASLTGGGIQVNEPNGSEVQFQDNGSSTTCPQGDSSNSSSYTVPAGNGVGTSEEQFCAPYRVDAQIGVETNKTTVFYVQGGRQSVTFNTEYATPAYMGNISNQDLLSYESQLVTPGSSGCPSTASTGTVGGCYMLQDGAGRTLIVVTGTPSNNSHITDDVLTVIDPADAQPYNFTYVPYSEGVWDEPASIENADDTSTLTQFVFEEGGEVPNEDNMTEIETALPGDTDEQIGYSAYDGYDLVTSIIDHTGANTTSYSYANTTCGPCLGSGNTQTTTVLYPDGEDDVDSYDEGILQSNTFGNSISGDQTITYGITYPTYPQDQDGPITETFTGPISTQTTTAQTDAVGDITQLEDAEGNYFTSTYNTATAVANLDELCWTAPGNSTNSCGSPPTGATIYGDDSYGDVTSVTDPYGNITQYGYNSALTLCWVAPPTVTGSGSACGAPDSPPTGAPVGATAYQYDAYGDIACEFDAYGESDQTTKAATYDEDGEMTAYYPPDAIGFGSFTCGSTIPNPAYGTTYAYTAGEMTTETDPNNQVTTTNYYDDLPAEVTDPTGKTITAYDADGRVCWTSRLAPSASPHAPPYKCSSNPSGSETSYTYLADTSAQATVTDPAGNVTDYFYADGSYPTSPTEILEPSATSVVYNTYDANGNVCDSGPVDTTSCGAQAGDTYYTYDALGEDVATMTDGNGNTTTYGYGDSAFPNLVTTETDALETNTWTYSYDNDGRLVQSTDPSHNVITTGYDADSRKCYQEVGSVTTFTCTTLPSGTGDSAWTYNPNGTLATMSDNLGTSQAATTTYTYDADGNPMAVVDDNGNTVNYVYNISGQVSCIGYPGPTKSGANCGGTASTSNPFVKYAYDAENRLSSTTDWLGNTTSYSYSNDGLNNLKSITYPTTSADEVTYGYNADSNVNSQSYSGTPLASIPSQSWAYNVNSLVKSATQLDSSGGTISSYTSSPAYDTSQYTNWVVSNTNPGASKPDSYAYNLNGELASDTPKGGSATSYDYNADDELCWSVKGSSSNACSSPPTGATTYTSTNDGQRCWSAPSSISGATCASPPSSGATGYAWNAYGELCWSGPTTSSPSCGSPPSGVTQYGYDGNGNRITETSPSGATEDFTWDTSGSTPLLLQDGTNAYIYGPMMFGGTAPVEQINLSSGAASYLTSAPSGVQLVLAQSGSVVNESSYSTYGTQSNSASAATPFGFQGGYTDPTGLIFLIHRYYDPSTGQFLSVDPEVATTVQPYAYANDDPLNLTDPTGEESEGQFLSWLTTQSHGVQVFFQCAAAHGVQACENFFSGRVASTPAASSGVFDKCVAEHGDITFGWNGGITFGCNGQPGSSQGQGFNIWDFLEGMDFSVEALLATELGVGIIILGVTAEIPSVGLSTALVVSGGSILLFGAGGLAIAAYNDFRDAF